METGIFSPKAIAMFEAVNELMEEGRELYNIKISDITSRAGIGKGTAYEYFDTKEELLGKAIFYQIHKSITQMAMTALAQRNFRAQIFSILNDIEENFQKRCVLLRYLCYYVEGNCKDAVCPQEYVEDNCQMGQAEKIVKGFIEQAQKEGLARKDLPDFLGMNALLTQIIGFGFYLHTEVKKRAVETGQMKEQVYENILRMIQ